MFDVCVLLLYLCVDCDRVCTFDLRKDLSRKEFQNVHLLMAKSDRPEVSFGGSQDFEFQLLINLRILDFSTNEH